MTDLEVRELRYFVAVAEELNFSRAAERLGMAQPPLSKAIQTLERRLGVTLLTRTTRQVSLTDAGSALLDQGRHAIEAVAAAAEHAVRAGRAAPRLVVSHKPGSDSGLMPSIAALYAAENAGPPIEIVVGGWGEQVAMVRSGRADVAVVRELIDRRGLDCEVLVTEPRRAVLGRGHRLAGAVSLTRADLFGEPVPNWPGSSAGNAAFRAGLDHLPGQPIPDGPEVSDYAQLVEVIALGMAIAFLPASAAETYPRPDLVYVPVEDLTPSTVYVAWSSHSTSRAVAAFVRAALAAAENSAQLAPLTRIPERPARSAARPTPSPIRPRSAP